MQKNKLIQRLLWDLPSNSCWCLRVAGLPGNIWISRGWECPKRPGSTRHVMLQGAELRPVRLPGTYLSLALQVQGYGPGEGVRRLGNQGPGL